MWWRIAVLLLVASPLLYSAFRQAETLFRTADILDEKEPIGDGTHERMVVNVARFDVRVQDKVAMVRGRA